MVKSTQRSVGHHRHCDKCYNLHCQVPVQISVSCMVLKCRRSCGASFHMCKQDEHQLLCPNEVVPCLNAESGCPLTMPRHMLAKHLEVCPASVVCCSQEWNRFPVSDTDLTFYKNVSENMEGDLDVALALRDQDLLFQSIKMKSLFPELTADDPKLQDVSSVVTYPAEEASCSFDCGETAENKEKELSQEERDALARSRDVTSIHKYNSWEKMFSKEKKGCNQMDETLNKEEKETEKEQESSNSPDREASNQEEDGSASGATGLAPWQDGVLERLGKEVNVAEYNMYLVHNGVMLINFGQLAACTPRDKDFVYGNLEPIEVKTIRTFNVPKSYRAKRSHLKDPARKKTVTHQSVDTADLGVSLEDLPTCEEISTTLLCCLEKELKGHLISESTSTDGYYVDIGTQTYSFPSAPFRADASLADIVAGKPRSLHMHVGVESITRRHNKTSSAFSYMCGRFFRRDEYCSHFRNVHCDIQASLNGWFQQRCPLAYLGCTFTLVRFSPTGHQAAIKYCKDVNSLTFQPQAACPPYKEEKTFSPLKDGVHNMDPLSRLPLEILQHIAGYLDSLTLSQLSQVSHLMREVCATLLQDRGMVSIKWEKKTLSDGRSSWICSKKVWKFSSVFASVDRWRFVDAPSMSDHLKTCSFYQREERTDPVALACLGEVRDKHKELKHTR